MTPNLNVVWTEKSEWSFTIWKKEELLKEKPNRLRSSVGIYWKLSIVRNSEKGNSGFYNHKGLNSRMIKWKLAVFVYFRDMLINCKQTVLIGCSDHWTRVRLRVMNRGSCFTKISQCETAGVLIHEEFIKLISGSFSRKFHTLETVHLIF